MFLTAPIYAQLYAFSLSAEMQINFTQAILQIWSQKTEEWLMTAVPAPIDMPQVQATPV